MATIVTRAGKGTPLTNNEIDANFNNLNSGKVEGPLLGTVSQSAGVPTGAVIERGSNANGEFVKFADGTMICTRDATVNGSTVSSTNATFPASFLTNQLIAASFSSGAGAARSTASANVARASVLANLFCSASTGTASGGFGDSWNLRWTSSDAAATEIELKLTAIGRWF